MKHLFSSTLFCLFLTFQIFAQSSNTTADIDDQIEQLAIEFKADYGSLSRFYEISDSPEQRTRFESFYKDYLKKIEALPFDNLSQSGKVDYLLMNNYINQKLFKLKLVNNQCNILEPWFVYAGTIYHLEQQRRRGKQMEWSDVADQLTGVGNFISEKTDELNSGNHLFSSNLSSRAKSIIRGQRKALKSVFDFYNGYDPAFAWWIEQPYQLTDSLLELYADAFNNSIDSLTLPKDDGSGIIGNPIGHDMLVRQLQTEMINYGPDKLVEIALKEFEWCEQELLKASREMKCGDDWKLAQEQVKQSYVEPGKQPEAMYELYEQSIDFLRSKDLITIPPLAEETWRMKMLSPEKQLIAPFFLGGEILQIAFPTHDMTHKDKLMSLRGNNPHFARAVVHHELIAGHHLQGFMNERYNTHRFFYTPFWTEGWALYWEMILWDEGFARSPEDRIGMLFWRMHRCARIIFSINYHLGKWTPQQCIDYLVDRVGHERSTAEGEVRRSFTGGYGPLYQIAYMIGGLQFYKLKEEIVDTGKMTMKEFHDAVMQENNIPVEMLRVILLDKKLTKDYKTSWKFYDK